MSLEFGATLADLEKRIYGLVGHEFNIGSPKQLGSSSSTSWGCRGRSGHAPGYSTDASVLEELRDEHAVVDLDPGVPRDLEAEVDLRRRAAGAGRPSDGRLHTTFQQAVAATGRLSSKDPNLQNIPIRTALGRRIRRAFVAPPGKLLLGADYSQMELRILAHVSGDAGLNAAFAAALRRPPAAAAACSAVPEEVRRQRAASPRCSTSGSSTA